MWRTPENVQIGQDIVEGRKHKEAINNTKLIGAALLKAGLKDFELDLGLTDHLNGQAEFIVSFPVRDAVPDIQEKFASGLSMAFHGEPGHTKVGKSSFTVHLQENGSIPAFSARLAQVHEVEASGAGLAYLKTLVADYKNNSKAKPESAKSNDSSRSSWQRF